MKGKTLLIALLLGPFVYAWQGLVLSILWKWFLVPIGAPIISVAIGAGIILMYQFFAVKPDEDSDKDLLKKFLGSFISPAIVFVFGFIIQLFV